MQFVRNDKNEAIPYSKADEMLSSYGMASFLFCLSISPKACYNEAAEKINGILEKRI